MRRFTRLTNGFSKKLDNLKAAVALHFAHYNLVRMHWTLRVTPAMAAGVSDRLWTVDRTVGADVEVKWTFLAIVLAAGVADSHTLSRNLYFLPNGYVRFDNGPPLDMPKLRLELKRMERISPRPQIHLQPAKPYSYDVVARVLVEFQRSGCCDLGFRGFEK